MGLSFSNAHGSAKKSELEYIKLELGETRFRLVGDILPRYCYWKKLKGGASIPVECLAFDREQERFTNMERDYFRESFPDEKCVWSYAVQAIDLKDNKLKLLGLKKKLFAQIQELAAEIGDPTDPVTGWDCIVDKKSTGNHAFNVEYKLKDRLIEVRALSDDEMEIIKDIKSIDAIIPRPTAEAQKAFIDQAWLSGAEEEKNVDPAAVDELDDDIPF